MKTLLKKILLVTLVAATITIGSIMLTGSYLVAFAVIAIALQIGIIFMLIALFFLDDTETLQVDSLESLVSLHRTITEYLEEAESDGDVYLCDHCEYYHVMDDGEKEKEGEEREEGEIDVVQMATDSIFEEMMSQEGGRVSKPPSFKTPLGIFFIVLGILAAISLIILKGLFIGGAIVIAGSFLIVSIWLNSSRNSTRSEVFYEIATSNKDNKEDIGSVEEVKLTPEEESSWTAIVKEMEKGK